MPKSLKSFLDLSKMLQTYCVNPYFPLTGFTRMGYFQCDDLFSSFVIKISIISYKISHLFFFSCLPRCQKIDKILGPVMLDVFYSLFFQVMAPTPECALFWVLPPRSDMDWHSDRLLPYIGLPTRQANPFAASCPSSLIWPRSRSTVNSISQSQTTLHLP